MDVAPAAVLGRVHAHHRVAVASRPGAVHLQIMPAAQRGDRLAQIDRDLLAAAGAQLPEIGGGEPGCRECSGTGRTDAKRRRQHRVGAAGDLDRAGPLLGPAGDRQDRHPTIIGGVVERIRQLGGVITRDPISDLLTVNGEFTASLVIARCRYTDTGSHRWLIRLDSGLAPDITVAVRMDADNRAALDYYLLPRIDMAFEKLLLAEDNGKADVLRLLALFLLALAPWLAAEIGGVP